MAGLVFPTDTTIIIPFLRKASFFYIFFLLFSFSILIFSSKPSKKYQYIFCLSLIYLTFSSIKFSEYNIPMRIQMMNHSIPKKYHNIIQKPKYISIIPRKLELLNIEFFPNSFIWPRISLAQQTVCFHIVLKWLFNNLLKVVYHLRVDFISILYKDEVVSSV